MDTGKESRSGEESALKNGVTCDDVGNSEDEIFASIERDMRRVSIKHDLTGITCLQCMEKGHFGQHCPKITKEEEVANLAPSGTSSVRW